MADERPGHSMCCWAEFHFDGRLEQEPFERAVQLARSRHRLSRAVVQGEGKQQVWVPTDRRPPIYWNHPNPGRESVEFPQLDIRQMPGVRCWVNVESEEHDQPESDGDRTDESESRCRSTLRFEFHHACCDAIGGMGMIEDLSLIHI